MTDRLANPAPNVIPFRKPSRHARGEGIRSARKFNETTAMLASEIAVEKAMLEWAEEFPNLCNGDLFL
jgi:hypothetical protein